MALPSTSPVVLDDIVVRTRMDISYPLSMNSKAENGYPFKAEV